MNGYGISQRKDFTWPLLLEMLLQKDGLSGVGHQDPSRGQEDVPRPVLDLDPAPKQLAIPCHFSSLTADFWMGQ